MFAALSLTACNDNKWLEEDPKNIITDEQTWNDPALVKSLLANYYDRLPTFQGVFGTRMMCDIDDAMYSGHMDNNGTNDFDYSDSYGRYWDYTLIRDINLGLENLDTYSKSISENEKKMFRAEMRFIRAYVYFELVKRMGGVPIVTTQLIYSGGDPTPLRIPRAKEYEVYDFIHSELDEIKDDLAGNAESQTRVNYYTVLALDSRAMLYAASIAKYNNQLSAPITLPGGEVGIPAEKANDYYKKSLDASTKIINGGAYQLYAGNTNKGENFYDMLNNKTREVIFAKDYKADVKSHYFTYDNIVRSLTEDNETSSTISPSLNLVESFDYLNGDKGTLKYKDANGNFIPYDNITAIYENKDARFYGTVIYPGTSFRSTSVQMLAGVAVWNGTNYALTPAVKLGDKYTDGEVQTGLDGPMDGIADVSNTGFYLRKMVSNASGASARGIRATNWWPWFRLGEMYLNAAEAAFELGDQSTALTYVNKVREVHGGFVANSLSSITMDKIRNERRVELAFEDHRYFDLKRWRIAHEVWNGVNDSEDAVVYGLYPYRIYRPGHPDNGKYIYNKMRPSRFKRARYFRMANYYSSIDAGVLTNNPKIVKNPFH